MAAMQATSVYRIPPYELLDHCGFEVMLVNARRQASSGPKDRTVSDADSFSGSQVPGKLTRCASTGSSARIMQQSLAPASRHATTRTVAGSGRAVQQELQPAPRRDSPSKP